MKIWRVWWRVIYVNNENGGKLLMNEIMSKMALLMAIMNDVGAAKYLAWP